MSSLVNYEQRIADIQKARGTKRIHYIKCRPPKRLIPKATVILLHDFFRTSYQFRHVIDLFAMGGYIAIAPELVNFCEQQSTGLANLKALASSLCSFCGKSCADTPVHFIGCGLGAQLAARIASAHPEMVATLIRTRAESLNVQLKHIMSLTPSSSKNTSTQAFEADLLPRDHDSELITSIDIEEYASSYSSPQILASMQKSFAAREPTISNGLEASDEVIPTHFVQTDPELKPEDWAITILRLLNRSIKTNLSQRQARL